MSIERSCDEPDMDNKYPRDLIGASEATSEKWTMQAGRGKGVNKRLVAQFQRKRVNDFGNTLATSIGHLFGKCDSQSTAFPSNSNGQSLRPGWKQAKIFFGLNSLNIIELPYETKGQRQSWLNILAFKRLMNKRSQMTSKSIDKSSAVPWQASSQVVHWSLHFINLSVFSLLVQALVHQRQSFQLTEFFNFFFLNFLLVLLSYLRIDCAEKRKKDPDLSAKRKKNTSSQAV